MLSSVGEHLLCCLECDALCACTKVRCSLECDALCAYLTVLQRIGSPPHDVSHRLVRIHSGVFCILRRQCTCPARGWVDFVVGGADEVDALLHDTGEI